MKVSPKFKKILSIGFRAAFKNHKIRVALNPLDRIFENLAESLELIEVSFF